MAKKYGWLVGALADKGYSQADLARGWKVDDAVVSRFINTGKPDLTIERQQILAQMLEMDFNELMARLTEGLAPRRQLPKPSLRTEPVKAAGGAPDAVESALANARAAVKRVQELLPDAKVHFSVVFNNNHG